MEPLRGKTSGAQEPGNVYTKLERIAELARRFPERSFVSLAHHMDVDFLKEAFRRTRKDGAPGIDGETGKDYEENLEANLRNLHEKAKSGLYRAPAVKRAYIPKDNGEKRPLGVPTFEDKVLQRGVTMILEALYEQDFHDASYGFRPKRSAHMAIEAVWKGVMNMGGCWILEVDIRKFFDTLGHEHLMNLLRIRVQDGVLTRLIGKWLNAGVMEKGEVTYAEAGTPQGGVISPLLANIYLHYVLDEWFAGEVVRRLKGKAKLIRYADDFVILFEEEQDARRVMGVLPKRFGKFGLALHPDKTRLIDFRPGKSGTGGSPGTFDFLGFTHFWGKSMRGNLTVRRKTSKKRLKRSLLGISIWCRSHRHLKVSLQAAALTLKLRGHYAYFGITHNMMLVKRFYEKVKRIWRYWLDRRSQGRKMPWDKFVRLLQIHRLPEPRLVKSALRCAAKP